MCGLCHVPPKIFFYIQEKIILQRKTVTQQTEINKLMKTLRDLDKMRVIKEDQTKHIFCKSTSGKFRKIQARWAIQADIKWL